MDAVAGTQGRGPTLFTSPRPPSRSGAVRLGIRPQSVRFGPREVRLMDFGWILLIVVGSAFALVLVLTLLQINPRDDDDLDRRR